jgi:predicted RNA-binding Zn-ribbon protein involved in translation (DUF1610 family)
MFRRPFVRPMRRAMRPEVHPPLKRANQLMATGNFATAAQAYEQLAVGAQRRGLPRDAHLFLQAGRCRILAGQVQEGMNNLKQGLGVFARRGNLAQMQKSGELVITDLKQRGFNAEAVEIEGIVKTALPASSIMTSSSTPFTTPVASQKNSKMLPTICLTCGGPLRPDEVEWLDDASAECPYCGGVIRAE